jgi:hypothetical protein
MIQIKSRKEKYRNADKKLKAAFRGHGFQANSKTYLSIMNLTDKIIRHNEGNRTAFFVRRNTVKNRGGEKYESE